MNLGNVDNFFLWINFGNDRIRTWGAGSRSKYANHCTMLPPAYPPTLSDLQLSGRVAWKVVLVGALTIDHLPLTRWIVKGGLGIFMFFSSCSFIFHSRRSSFSLNYSSTSFWQQQLLTKWRPDQSNGLEQYQLDVLFKHFDNAIINTKHDKPGLYLALFFSLTGFEPKSVLITF